MTECRRDAVRAVENLAVDRRPGLIIRCSGVADVIDGVNLARERGFTLAIRAGGHHSPATAPPRAVS